MSTTSRRLFLKNLPRNDLKRDELLVYLERFGPVSELKIVEGDAQRYGFVQFSSQESSQLVLETFRDKLFLGHPIVIEPARPLRKDVDSHSARPRRRYPVIVSNLPPHICWQELKDFGRLAGGLVVYCDLDRNRSGRGFIEYLKEEDAAIAIRKLDGQTLDGHVVRVSMSVSAPGRPRRSRSPASRTRGLSRSRSPARRTPYRLPSPIYKPGRQPSRHFPISAERYSPRTPPRADSTQFTHSPYTVETAIPVVLHPELHPYRAAESYRSRSGLFVGTEVSEATMPRSTSVIDALAAKDVYHAFDQYLRLEYERCSERYYS